MKKLLFIFLTVTSFSTFALDNSSSKTDAKIQAALDQTRTQYGASAMQVSVSLPGEYASRNFVSGTTKLNGKNKLTTDNLFQIGSITKSFVSAIILQLEAKGELSIDDPIDKYIDFSKHPTWPAEWQNVTIKQLLNMTSGIYNYTEDKTVMASVFQNPNEHFTATQLVDVAAKHPDDFKPGTSWNYSNTDYVLAGMIIKNVTGKSVTQVMNEKLLGSTHLNLLNTYYQGAHDYSPNVLRHAVDTYFTYEGTNPDVAPRDISSSSLSWANSAGCMLSNTSDIVRWVRALFSGQVLKPQQLNEMESLVCTNEMGTPNCVMGQPIQPTIGVFGYGLGIAEFAAKVRGSYIPVWMYEGHTLGQTFIYYFIPSDNTVISVNCDFTNKNLDYDPVNKLATKIFMILNESNALKNYHEAHGMPAIDASQLQTSLNFPQENGFKI